VSIVPEHVEFKQQLKGKDGDGKDGEEKPEAATTDEPAAAGQVQEEGEIKEAASF
jgi:hypothetical protein